VQGSLVRISKQQFEQLQNAGQSHCLLVSYHKEKPLLTGRQKRGAAERRSRRLASRERQRESQHVAKEPRRSERIATVQEWKEGLLAEVQWIDGSQSVELETSTKDADAGDSARCDPTESHEEDRKEAASPSKKAKRRRGRPIMQARELEFYIVIGAISFVNEACARHANLVPYGQSERGQGEQRMNQWHETSVISDQHLRARREVAFQYEDNNALERQCIWCGVEFIDMNASESGVHDTLRATAEFLGWSERDVRCALQAR
jgi:hypothetical protein